MEKNIYAPTIEGWERIFNNIKTNYLSKSDGEIVIEITYKKLRTLRDTGNLKPGKIYRLTDYECTTTQEHTRAKNNHFDLLILALDNKTLCEECHACLHNGDRYFINSHLESWKVWYSIDNDLNRFGWVLPDYLGVMSVTGGKGNYYGYICIGKENGKYKWGYAGTYDGISSSEKLQISFNANKYNVNIDYSDIIYTDSLNLTENTELKFEIATKGTALFVCSILLTESLGKGCIYRLIDENCNDIPYDFKNILFKRWYGKGNNDLDGTYCIANFKNLPKNMVCPNENDYIWLYTFSIHLNGMEYSDVDSSTTIYDKTIFITNNRVLSDEALPEECHDNIIKPRYGEKHNDNIQYQGQTQFLNNITFLLGCEDTGAGYYYSDYAYGTFGNTFGVNCYDNSIGNKFYHNSIENSFYYNSIGNSFSNNSIGNDFLNNSIGNDFYYNSIGNGFSNNSIGNYFLNNSIGNFFSINSIGNDFYANSIGNSFYYNSIGNSFWNNSIGIYFEHNSIGNSFYYNSIGNFIYYITINDGVMYVNIIGSLNGLPVQNCHIFSGVQGDKDNNKLNILFQLNKKYTQFAALKSDNTLEIWTRK